MMSSVEIPSRMLAAQVVEFNKPYQINEVPVPTDLGPKDLLIRVAVASLCHTDFMVSKGIMGTPLPCTGSHEGAGTVVAVGSAIDGKSFQTGDRVMAGILYQTCGACAECLGPESYSQYCTKAKHCGVKGVDGFFAEYAKIDARWAAKLPDEVTFETAAPLACAGCTVYRGVLLAGLKKGEWMGIVGSGGGLGHLGVQFARALGFNVVGVDARDEGLELSKQGGATVVIDARIGHDKVVEEVKKISNGEGVAATVNVSDAEAAVATACAITQMHGTVVQLAQPEKVAIPFHELVFRDIRIRGSLVSSAGEARAMLKVVAQHGISVQTNAFQGLKEMAKLVGLAESGNMRGKGIIIMDEEQVNQERKAGRLE